MARHTVEVCKLTNSYLTWHRGVKFRSESLFFFFSFGITAASQGSQIKRVSKSSSTGDLTLMLLEITWNDSIDNPVLPQPSHWIRLALACWTDSKILNNLMQNAALCNNGVAQLLRTSLSFLPCVEGSNTKVMWGIWQISLPQGHDFFCLWAVS